MKTLFLTFDLEEFDLPIDYNTSINENDMYRISYDGAEKILSLLHQYNVCSTFFVTAKFGERYPELIKRLSESGHEIALHGYQHSHDYQKMDQKDAYEYLKRAKQILEEISGKEILGFRAPRMMLSSYDILEKIGIRYDSSLHPTYVPGRYNNISKPRKIFINNGVKVVPISVTPVFRLPFSWIWFRNFGLTYSKICTKLSLSDLDFINIYFHPWEFAEIKNYQIPALIKRNTGEILNELLKKYLQWCFLKGITSTTISNYIKHIFVSDANEYTRNIIPK